MKGCVSYLPSPLSRRKVDLDVDENHDGGGDVEGAEGRVHHVAEVLAQLQKRKIAKSLDYCGSWKSCKCRSNRYAEISVYSRESCYYKIGLLILHF